MGQRLLGLLGSRCHPDHTPGAFWKWRMHGAFLTLADELALDVSLNGTPDVILASSMMDVAAFARAARHFVPGMPIAVYFHENQFTYPLSPSDRPDATYQMKNWTSAATADLVIFNSHYYRTVFKEEARRFLNSFPEYKHVREIDGVMNASVVLPVGIDISDLASCGATSEIPPLSCGTSGGSTTRVRTSSRSLSMA